MLNPILALDLVAQRCSTAGRSALNCSTAWRKSAISVREAEEQLQKLFEMRHVGDRAAHHLLGVLGFTAPPCRRRFYE